MRCWRTHTQCAGQAHRSTPCEEGCGWCVWHPSLGELVRLSPRGNKPGLLFFRKELLQPTFLPQLHLRSTATLTPKRGSQALELNASEAMRAHTELSTGRASAVFFWVLTSGHSHSPQRGPAWCGRGLGGHSTGTLLEAARRLDCFFLFQPWLQLWLFFVGSIDGSHTHIAQAPSNRWFENLRSGQ